MKITEVKGKDFDGKVYRDIDLACFGGLKKPDENCIIVVGEATEWIDEDGKNALNCSYDMDFLKTTPEMARKTYNGLVEDHIKGVGNSDVYCNNDAMVAFGIYKKNDEEWIVTALDGDMSVWGIGLFGGVFEVNGEVIDIGVSEVDYCAVAHASIYNCKEWNEVGFFDDETTKTLFTEEQIEKWKQWKTHINTNKGGVAEW